MNRLKFATVVFFLSIIHAFTANSQGHLKLIAEGERDFSKLREAFYAEWKEEGSRYSELKKFKRWENFMVPRLVDGKIPGTQYFKDRYKTFELERARQAQRKGSKTTTWEPLGPVQWEVGNNGYNPGNGRINCISVDPTDSMKIYIGAAGGGFWKSTDGGKTWNTSTDDLGVLGVTDIYIDPDNTDRIIILTGDAYGNDTPSIGLFESLDAGESWQLMNLSFDRNSFRTFYKLEVGQENKDLMYVAGSNIIRSDDGGETWDEVLSGSFSDLVVHPTNDSIVYACSRNEQTSEEITLFKSVDAGITWEELQFTFPEANKRFDRKAMAVTADNPDVVYILASASDATFGGLFKSSDQLETVDLMSFSPNIFGYSKNADDGSGQGWYDLAIGVSPENEHELYVSGIHVWKSQDSGANWALQNYWVWGDQEFPYVHADNHTIDFYHGNLYCGGDGGIFFSNDDGDSFENLSFGLSISQFYRLGTHPTEEDVVIGGLQDNGSFTKIDNEWYHIYGADGMEALIDHTDPSIVYSEYQFGGIIRYINEGLDADFFIENSDNENGGWITPFIMHPDDHNTLYFGYQNVWKSTDQGTTLNKQSRFQGGSVINILKMHPTETSHFLVGRGGLLLYSEDEAENFTSISSGLPARNLNDAIFDVNDPGTMWTSFSGGLVYQSDDAGASWFSLSEGLPNLSVNCLLQHPCGEILYAGTDVGVYTLNLSIENPTWEYMGEGLPNVVVRELEIQGATNKLYIATYGRGIWKIEVPNTNGGNQDQIITFQEIEEKRLGDARFALGASSSSDLPLSYVSSDNSIIQIVGDSADVISRGTVEITASQKGNCEFKSAESVSITVEVVRGTQTIDFKPIPTDITFKQGESFGLLANSSAGLPVIFSSSDENMISINKNLATVMSSSGGTVVISANQEGNEDYAPAETVEREIVFLILDANILNSEMLYPNPASRFVTVPESKVGEVFRVFNFLGKQIASGQISARKKVDLTGYQPGSYILMLGEEPYRIIKK